MKNLILIALITLTSLPAMAANGPTDLVRCHGPLSDKSHSISRAYFKRIEGSRWVGRALILKTWNYKWTKISDFYAVENGTAGTGLKLNLKSKSDKMMSEINVVARPNPSELDTTLMTGETLGTYSTENFSCAYEDDFQYDLRWPTASMRGTEKLLELINY